MTKLIVKCISDSLNKKPNAGQLLTEKIIIFSLLIIVISLCVAVGCTYYSCSNLCFIIVSIVSLLIIRFVVITQLDTLILACENDFLVVTISCRSETDVSLRKKIIYVSETKIADENKLLFVVANDIVETGKNDIVTVKDILKIFGREYGDIDEHTSIKNITLCKKNKAVKIKKALPGR